ncbi:MAG TPA: uroporphyrinogen decarboxylase family protein [Candidatus Deferrimicrobium sp.]|nr:uroporphyrinogen decarboxylase family protein [Candidatus Deferrimicrobium sp.]
MEPRERVLTALNLEEPDRIPTHLLYLDANNVDNILGKPEKDNFEVMYDLQKDYSENWIDQMNGIIEEMQVTIFSRLVEAALHLGFDVTQIGIIPLKIINEHEMEDIFGKIWAIRNNEGNILPQYKRGTINSIDKWEEIKELFEDGTNYRYCKLAKKYFKRIYKRFKNKIFIFATNELASIWASTWQGLGMEFFVKQLYTNRDLIKDMFNIYTDFTIAWLNAYMDGGAEICLCTDDLATKTAPFMSPKLFTELLQPCYQRLTDNIHNRGGKVILHTDGQITPLLDFIVGCGFDGLHSLEPAAGVDLAVVKKKVGSKICLFGNIDTTYILTKGTKEEVEDAVKFAIKTAGPGGGFILSSENMLYTVRIENLKWMIEACHKYGQYPLTI